MNSNFQSGSYVEKKKKEKKEKRKADDFLFYSLERLPFVRRDDKTRKFTEVETPRHAQMHTNKRGAMCILFVRMYRNIMGAGAAIQTNESGIAR